MYDLTYRPRRLRTSPEMRDLVRETTLDTTDLIYPLFIVPGEGIKKEIDTLPGQYHLSVDEAVKVAQEAYDLGIRGVEIFGIPTYKDEQGSSAWDMEQPVNKRLKPSVKQCQIYWSLQTYAYVNIHLLVTVA